VVCIDRGQVLLVEGPAHADVESPACGHVDGVVGEQGPALGRLVIAVAAAVALLEDGGRCQAQKARNPAQQLAADVGVVVRAVEQLRTGRQVFLGVEGADQPVDRPVRARRPELLRELFDLGEVGAVGRTIGDVGAGEVAVLTVLGAPAAARRDRRQGDVRRQVIVELGRDALVLDLLGRIAVGAGDPVEGGRWCRPNPAAPD
jgi:hypothetical protein